MFPNQMDALFLLAYLLYLSIMNYFIYIIGLIVKVYTFRKFQF